MEPICSKLVAAKSDENGGQPVEKQKSQNPIRRVTLGENIKKTNFPTDIGMIERSWHVARIHTDPTMCQTLDFAKRKWEESGCQVA